MRIYLDHVYLEYCYFDLNYKFIECCYYNHIFHIFYIFHVFHVFYIFHIFLFVNIYHPNQYQNNSYYDNSIALHKDSYSDCYSNLRVQVWKMVLKPTPTL